MKTVLTAAVLALSPLAAFAMCGHDTAAQSCASGFHWDAETGACVESVTG